MSNEEALEQLARSSGQAVVGVLSTFGGGDGVGLVDVRVSPRDGEPLDGMPPAGVAAAVNYVDGVTGGNVLCVNLQGARRLANAMMGLDPSADVGDEPLSELELSAVSEAANQAMAASAQATAGLLGTEVDISPPETKAYETTARVLEAAGSAEHAVTASITLFDEPCRLVQIVPTAFVVRMTRALDQKALEVDPSPAAAAAAPVPGEDGTVGPRAVGRTLTAARVRVWAELGRTRMPVGRAVALPEGAIVELDRNPDDLIDIYVNGRRLALGRLVITDGGRWAVRVERMLEDVAREDPNPKGVSPRWLESL